MHGLAWLLAVSLPALWSPAALHSQKPAAPLQPGATGRTAQQVAANPALGFVHDLPGYTPRAQVAGTIRMWGHGSFKRDFMGKVITRWMREFQARQPGVKFEYDMFGSASAIGALSTGAGNLAILGEEISPAAEREFTRAHGYAPTEVDVATGSLDVNGFDFAHAIFVARDNPLPGLSVPQLRAIFGAEPGGKAIRTWDQLGVGGKWAGHPIQLLGWRTDVDFALFLRERVLGGGHRWNPNIREYMHGVRADGSQYDWGERILDAAAQDPYAMALSTVRFPEPALRVVPLSERDGGPYVQPTDATLIDQSYPLTRIIPAYVDRAPGKPMEPLVREFLSYLLSREGQTALIEDSDYLPLGAGPRGAQERKLR